MITVSLNYDDSKGRVKLAHLRAMLDPIRLNSIVGRAGVNVIRDHLLKLEQSRPNRLGGDRQHYYARAAESTHFTAMAKSALVTVSYVGFRLRRFGGTVRPARKKFLTIPIIAAAYGRRAGEFEGAFVIRKKGKDGKAYIADRPAGRYLRLLFRLVPSATIEGDSTIMPEDWEITQAVTPALKSYVARQARRIQAAEKPEDAP